MDADAFASPSSEHPDRATAPSATAEIVTARDVRFVIS